MDVRCPRCHVEYEFDDDKVTTAGVAVQCTGCNHVFRVAKPAPAPSTTAPEKEEWMVRQQDGRVIRFKELTTLQKWIVEQKVARTDEISRTGRTWRPLGDIAELSSFFQVVDAARAAQSMAAHGVVSAPVMPPPHAILPALEPAQHTIQNVGLPPLAVHDIARTNATPTTTPSIQTASTEVFFAEERSLDALDDDDPVKLWRDRQRLRRAVLLVAIVVVSAGAATVALRPEILANARALIVGASEEEQALVARVERALTDDKEGEIEAVDKILEATLKASAREPKRHALRARTLVARARSLMFAGVIVVDDADRKERERQARALIDQAGTHVLLALDDADVTSSARIASADVQAARGALLEMESDLELALAADASPSTTRDVAVIRALGRVAQTLAAPGADSETPEKQRAVLNEIVKAQSLSPDDARLLYASLLVRTRSALAARTPEGAPLPPPAALVADVERALTTSPFHLGLRALRETLAARHVDHGATPAPPAPADDAATKPQSTTTTPRDPNEQSPPQGDVKPSATVANDDDGALGFDALLAKAERLRRSDRSRLALSLYQKAAQMRPTDARPHLGLGWANLDLDRGAAAVVAFKKALSLDGGLADAQLGLGEAHRGRGEHAAAVTAFKAYLRLAPNGDEANVAKRAIQQLEAAP